MSMQDIVKCKYKGHTKRKIKIVNEKNHFEILVNTYKMET